MDLEPEAIEALCQTNPGKQVTGATKARNDLKWESFREDVRIIYMDEDQSLAIIQKVIAEKYDFKASDRKWKDKLKEWGFSKNIPRLSSTDMEILVHKREKRLRDEGKETDFNHRGKLLTKEKLDSFKRTKMGHDEDERDVLWDISTPKNISYHTPKPQGEMVVDRIIDLTGEIESAAIAQPVEALHLSNEIKQYPTAEHASTIREQLEAKTISDDNEESIVRGSHQKTNTPALTSSFSDEDVQILSEETLRMFTELQLISYLMNISRTRRATADTFERLASVLLQKATIAYFNHSTKKMEERLAAFSDLYKIVTDNCGIKSPVALHLKCRYAFLLGSSHLHLSKAKDIYDEIVILTSGVQSRFFLNMNIRCRIALECFHTNLLQEKTDCPFLDECFPVYLRKALAMMQDQSEIVEQDFMYQWPIILLKARDNIVLRPLKVCLTRPHGGVGANELSLIQSLVETVTAFCEAGCRASEETLGLFYDEVLNQIANRHSSDKEKAIIYRACIHHYTSHEAFAKIRKVAELANILLNTWQRKSKRAKSSFHDFRRLHGSHRTGPRENPVMEELHAMLEALGLNKPEMHANSDEEDLFPEEEDENKNRSRYGSTYTSSTMTGISNSEFMVP